MPAGYLAVGGNYGEGVYISRDGGASWAIVLAHPSFTALGYANGKWIAANNGSVYYSDDGLRWADTGTTISGQAGSIVHNGSRWALLSNWIDIYASDDGLTWTQITYPSLGPDGWLNAITAVPGMFIASGQTELMPSSCIRSTD